MVKIIRIFKEKTWLLAIFIFIVAFTLRIIAAFKIAWRPDEIVYVDWIGQWFSHHFFSYFFQFYHHTYPPQSPAFGNPPLAMWIMSLGIWIAKLFGGSALLGARMINVLIGSFTCLYLFNFARKWFNLRVAVIASFSLAVIPVILTNSSTAYLETLLVLLVLISLDLLFKYGRTGNGRFLYYCGSVLGLAFLTKYIIIPFILVLVFWIPIVYRPKKFFWRDYIITTLIAAATPIILWSGLRDPNHISSIYWMYKQKIYNPYTISYNFPIFRYFYFMLLGILPPIITLGAIAAIVILIKKIIKTSWKNYQKEILFFLLILVFLVYNSIFTKYSGSNQILPILPLIVLLSAIGIEIIFSYFQNKYLSFILYLIFTIAMILPLLANKIQYWNLYNSSFIKTNSAFHFYIVGLGGEEIPAVADFINKNTPSDSRTAIIAGDWELKKYLSENRTATPLFLNEGVGGALARSADYFVLPRVYTETIQGGMFEPILKLPPLFTVSEKGIILARIYQADYSNVKDGEMIEANKGDWEISQQENKPEINFSSGNVSIHYNFTNAFNFNEYRRSLVNLKNKNKFGITGRDGIYVEVYGDGNSKNITFILTGEDKSTLTFETSLDWKGWKSIFIPSSMFSYSKGTGVVENPNLNQKYDLTIAFGSPEKLQGDFEIRNIKIVNIK